MERLDGEIRDRERTMRCLKRTDTPILAALQVYHNLVKPHEALKGKTPAQAAGVGIEGENRWFELMKRAIALTPEGKK